LTPDWTPLPLAYLRRIVMSVEEQNVIVNQWIEAWNKQDLAAASDLLRPDYKRHDANLPDLDGSKAGVDFITTCISGFPDIHLDIEQLIAQDDHVAARLTVRGTHQGPFMGVPATGRKVTVEVADVYRLADGKIAEQWVMMNAMGLMQQLGVIPSS
jgi:steroid delta-isomerase-like uncharacterized protein